MKMLVLHMPSTTGGERQVAVNVDEILRMEEVEGGTTQIIQQDKGPTTVRESLEDILKALDEELVEVKPEPTPKEQKAATHPEAPRPGQPIGQQHKGSAGGR